MARLREIYACLLFCVWASCAAGQGTVVNSVDVFFELILSGTDPLTLDTTNLNATTLVEKLNEIAATDEATYGRLASALLKSAEASNEGGQVITEGCGVGSYIDQTTKVCTPCPAGTFSITVASTSAADCLKCAAGTYSGMVGAGFEDACTPCGAGTFSAVQGATNSSVCRGCGVGSTSVLGAQSIDACVCLPGFYRPSAGAACVPCEEGYWCANGARTSCVGRAAGKSTSSARASAAEHCFCLPGYYGYDYFGSGCMDCDVNSYCTGAQGDGNQGLMFSCPADSSSGMNSVSVDACVCASSFRKQFTMPADRSLLIDVEPCNCTNARSPPTCKALDVAGCVTCSPSSNCDPDTHGTLTCKQGYLEMMHSITAGDRTWVIAPAGALGVTIHLKRFEASTIFNKMFFDQCSNTNFTLCNNKATLSGSAPARTIKTDPGFTVFRLRWTSTSITNSPVSLEYSSEITCNKNEIAVRAGSVYFSGTGDTIPYPFQPEQSWPIVVWFGDALTFTPNAVKLDVRRGSPTGSSVLNPVLGLGFWIPDSEGDFWLVDVEFPSRARQIYVAPVDARKLQAWYNVVNNGFTLTGDVNGVGSPDIVLVSKDVLTMGRLTSAHGVVLLSRWTNATSWALLSGPGIFGQSVGGASAYESSLTWDTSGYDPGVYYYGSVNSLGVVKVGRIILYPTSGGASCAPCREGEFCYDGNALRCPANSRSPPSSTSVNDCKCSPGYAVSDLDLEGYGNSQTVDSGGRHSCVVAQNGSLWCWGANEKGQLGLGFSSASHEMVPRMVPGLSDVRNISLGDDFTCAVVGSGARVKCWGNNFFGQLGLDSNDASQFSPGADAKLGGGTNAYETRSIACAGQSCCAIVSKEGGVITLTCWGNGQYGQLGKAEGSVTNVKNVGTATTAFPDRGLERYSYAMTGDAISLGSHVAASITLAVEHGCVVTTGGAVLCWGLNMYGVIGIGVADQIIYNPREVNVGGMAKTVNCFAYVCCAVMRSDFQVKCWGRGDQGRLGVGTFDIGKTPQSMGQNLPTVDLGRDTLVMDVNVGKLQTCVLLLNNYVKCWGLIGGNAVGDNPPADAMDMLPNFALADSTVALQINGKGETVCAVTSDYRVVCWGNNLQGQVGGPVSVAATGMALASLPSGVTALRSSGTPTNATCLVCAANTYCTGGGGLQAQCPANTRSPVKSTSVDSCVCLPGYKKVAGGGCELCQGREYCSVGVAYTCPAFSLTTVAGSSELGACQCEKGYYYAGSVLGCTPCQQGRYKAAVGNSGVCDACPAGTRSTVVGLTEASGCVPCGGGTFSSEGSDFCATCGQGTASGNGSAVCKPCGAGFFADSGASVCTPCGAGTFDATIQDGRPGTCDACTAGKFSPVLNATTDVCRDCPAGFFSAAGASECTACVAGTHSPQGAVSCTPCPANSTSLSGSVYSQCRCLAGFYKKFAEGGQSFVCEVCVPGEYSEFDAVGSCLKCPAGRVSTSRSVSSLVDACEACPKGKFSVSGAVQCQTCGTGTFAAADASPNCTDCRLGYWAAAGSSQCTACGSGLYATGKIGSAAQCLQCPAGGYCVGADAASAQGLRLFEPCPLGTFQNSTGVSSPTQCQPCPPNHFCPSPTLKGTCPDGTQSGASSVSQLQCVCRAGYTCKYSKVVNVVVTLLMGQSEWDNNADVRLAFKQAVAAAAKTTVDKVRITKVQSTGGGGRRLLSHSGRSGLHVVVEILGGVHSSEAMGRELDARLAGAGLRIERERAWIAPHSVEVRRLS